MRKHTIFISLFLLLNNYISAQWINQFTSANCAGINSINFSDSLTGIATGYYSIDFTGRILYTTDAGINWNFATLPDSTGTVIYSKIINPNLFYSCGLRISNISEKIVNTAYKHNVYGVSETDQIEQHGIFLISTNKGMSWNVQGHAPDPVEYFTSMDFLNANYGFANCSVGQGFQVGAFVKTTNAGQSWDFMTLPTDCRILNSMQLIDSLHIFSVGTKQTGNFFSGIIMKTTNSGNSWTYQTFPDVGTFKSISFINSSTGIAVGNANPTSTTENGGSIYKTTNQGVSWFNIATTLADTTYLNKVKFLPNGTGLIAGNKLRYTGTTILPGTISMLKSTDFGSTWRRNFINSVNKVPNGLELIHSTKYFAGGGDLNTTSSIYFTTDGGETFIHNNSNEIPATYSLSQNYPNPFNPITTISYQLAKKGYISITVFDILGKEIDKLVNQVEQPGSYSIQFNSSTLSSGIYFYTMQINDFLDTKRMLILK